MIVRCWGARGSIPVSGTEYVRYGGDTPCLEIRTKNDEIIIVDAGTGIRRLGNQLLRENRFGVAMVFTHSHWDHILGFPFFKPIYSPKTRIRIFGCPTAQGAIRQLLSDVMSPPHFPVRFDEIKADVTYQGECGGSFSIDSVTVATIPLSHPNRGLGFRFTEDGKSLVFLTDNELSYRHPGGRTYEDYREFSRGADLLIHDAEYTDEEYRKTEAWGHSRYRDALHLALDAGVKRFGLYHHNQDRSDDALDTIVDDCRRIIGEKGAEMECFALTQEGEITL
ncbi:MAG: MBL fold metallo-hydrolase [Alphaproteobacteria bacterium]|uniref:MBL fold metallo-hydrolase n=1 Tax=Candidatus Nitrobium versatile TaxID=2884831 RepID=A0A953JA57_9BACT|nr:MBL fold metallo-hydrolase [Candidatus Nitrobium versatile]